VVTGTDAPLDNPALGVHANMRMLVAHGWSAYDALRTATINPARYMGVSGDLGTLAPGKLADLIMVQGNPLERIEDAINVRMTIRNGVVFSTGELLRPFAGGDEGAGAVATVGAATAAPSRYWWHAPEVVAADYADDCDTVADH
jgi:adenine deaminase